MACVTTARRLELGGRDCPTLHLRAPGQELALDIAFLDSISGCGTTPLTSTPSIKVVSMDMKECCFTKCKIILSNVVIFQHPEKGLHFVEDDPMLAFHVGAIGNPELSNPGFGCISGECGCRRVRHRPMSLKVEYVH